jgi:hypothetical protein
VAQPNPRALGSLFVASYDSQGCGGGILTRLHTGQTEVASEQWAEENIWTKGLGPLAGRLHGRAS